MNFPRSVLISLIVMISMGVVAIALVPQRGRDAAILHVPQISEAVETLPPVEHALAVYSGDGHTVSLLKTSSSACQNMMGETGWYEANLVADDERVARGDIRQISACWHQYENFQRAWDGSHPERPIIAICPLIDGISRYMGCINIHSDAFEWH
jgi:hypothetical protein